MENANKSELANRVTFPENVGFHKTLKSRIQEHFESNRISAKDNWQMYLKVGIILAWVVSSYVVLVFFAQNLFVAIPLVLSLALSFSAVGFNIQHDGSHQSVSKSRFVNWLLGFTLDLLGGSSLLWRRKHNILHHTYTNINGMDEDIYDGSLFRLSPSQPHRWHHRFQHIYTYMLYAFLSLKWIFFDDWKKVISIKLGQEKLPNVSNTELLLLISTKAFHFLYTIVIPLFFHSFLTVVLFNLIFHFVLGFTLSVIFQMAHAVPLANFPEPQDSGEIEKEWAVHQVETTANFAMNNPIATWYTGGLNFQIEHHLFPGISHIHYSALSKIVRKTCEDFGIRYNSYKSFLSGFIAHYKWLRAMGRPV